MKWHIVASLLVVLLAPAVAGCQVSAEAIRAVLCEPVDPPADVVAVPEVVPELSDW